MKKITYLIVALAIAATFYFAVVSMGDEVSVKGLAVILAVTIPYFLGIGLLAWFKSRAAVMTMSIVMILLALVGSYMLYSSTMVHPDAQSGMAFFVVSVYQFPIILITAAFAFFMERRARQ